MNLKLLLLATAAGASFTVMTLVAAPAAGPARFTPHDIDAAFRGGYSVAVADFNKDGKMDVIANSLGVAELAWYENPTWEKHVIAPATQIVNQAMADIDGDGVPEIAFESAFAMQAANSEGIVWLARHDGDPRKPWKVQKIDAFPTSHHIAWIDLDGDGKVELVNAPLIGEKSVAPTYDQDKTPVFFYDQKAWKRHQITGDIPGIIHRVRTSTLDIDKRKTMLVASYEGIVAYKATGSGDSMKFTKTVLSNGHDSEKAPRLGASDVGTGRQDGKLFMASVEPWHGNEVVVYAQNGSKWDRRVIFDKIASGHEIFVTDLNGDGRDDIVANDNSTVNPRNPNSKVGGVHVFYAPENPVTGEWVYQRLDEKNGMNGCVGADFNNDKRMDIVCTGAGGVIRWYENRGPASAGTTAGR